MMFGMVEIIVIMLVATICLLILMTVASSEVKSVIRTWRSYDPLTGRLFETHEDREDSD